MKQFTLSISGVIVGAIIVAAFAFSMFAQANSTFTYPNLTANKNTVVTVGPDTNVQILATTSRAYANIAREGLVAAVYCNGNGDQAANASTAVTFKLSTTTGEVYEYFLEKNPYDGAVRCTASASTTIIVSEIKIK